VRARFENLLYSENIRLLGRVERKRVPELLSSCSALCVPSYGEPFGLSALEGMAMRRPVVGTDAGGLQHIIPEEGGYKVPPGDAEALANALRNVLSSPQRRREMGRLNRQVVEEKYQWEKVIDRLENVYYELE
jgi:glycosyltransferase involved in cell wall biosynthesis